MCTVTNKVVFRSTLVLREKQNPPQSLNDDDDASLSTW